MAESAAFFQLDERIQRYLWAEGWTELRDAQERATPLILRADRDVIIAAATASGKTEAAFLPAISHLLQAVPAPGLIVYIGPLKALINDQFQRLERLCEQLEIPVWPWHGDISASLKNRFRQNPTGVLLITPESLEAQLCNRGTAVGKLLEHTRYFVIDELHAFIGSERGKQLQSLLHRVEALLQRPIPRIGLSATLGDMQLAADFLRPAGGSKVTIIESAAEAAPLKLLIKGFMEPLVVPDTAADEEQTELIAVTQVAAHLFKHLRGTNNLVFPNRRADVEHYTHLLHKMCDAAQVPNEFWPHHGSLSKEIRAETEAALKQQVHPATAICTNTLELGIDIGAVKSVAQIGPPPSVASLRQRLGRSGRRKGESAILRGYSIELESPPDADLAAQLRLPTVRLTAMVSLLLERWFEPPRMHGLHLSTLVQQILALVAQYGGITAAAAYRLLCGPAAPFSDVTTKDFGDLLRHLGQHNLLMQESSGLLLHGTRGEQLVNHYTFYAAFVTDEEFRLVTKGKTLGSLPVTQLIMPEQHLVFAGRTWRVEAVDEAEKVIFVVPAPGGAPPQFAGSAGRIHSRVTQRMRELLAGSVAAPYLDETAQRFLREGRQAYANLGLAQRYIVNQGPQTMILTWLGDATNEALSCLLSMHGITAWTAGPGVALLNGDLTEPDLRNLLDEIAVCEPPAIPVLLANARNLEREKWDGELPLPLLQKSYHSLYLDMAEAYEWLRERPWNQPALSN